MHHCEWKTNDLKSALALSSKREKGQLEQPTKYLASIFYQFHCSFGLNILGTGFFRRLLLLCLLLRCHWWTLNDLDLGWSKPPASKKWPTSIMPSGKMRSANRLTRSFVVTVAAPLKMLTNSSGVETNFSLPLGPSELPSSQVRLSLIKPW